MCGIGGILHFDDRPVERPPLERMMAHLRPRGPDGHGINIDGPCGLVHTRLSVVDLMGGHQPMQVDTSDGKNASDGELTLVFNGEIYNHRTLRKRLERLGHAFTSDHCDTEVLLHGYREWGTELPKHLHGMFAFAVWDKRTRELFVCRDRAGKKPVYMMLESGRLIFGSLIGALLGAMRTTPDIDGNALRQFLVLGYTLDRSLLAGVEELPAAHWALIRPDGASESHRYWQPPPLSRTSTKLGAVDAIRELVVEAVAKRMEADVPLGCFLSGGVDSSFIAAIAQQELGGERLKTFSVSMPDARYDEGPYAQQVADHIGAEHRTLVAEPNVEDDLLRLVATVGEPFADSSILPTFWLSKATRRHVTVALSGDGGDELFGGYDRYRALRLIKRYRPLLRCLPRHARGDQKSFGARLARLTRAARWPTQDRQYLSVIRLFGPDQLGELRMTMGLPLDAPPNWEAEADPAEAARRWDMFHYLPYDLLRKVDRASMAVALEVRCPYLDTQVYDLAGHLPLGVLAPGGKSKALLKQAAAPYLPASILHRRKMGFAVPIGQWFRGPLRAMVEGRLLSGGPLYDRLAFRRRAVERLVLNHCDGRADHTHRLFALLSLAIWLDWLTDPKAPKPLL